MVCCLDPMEAPKLRSIISVLSILTLAFLSLRTILNGKGQVEGVPSLPACSAYRPKPGQEVLH